MIIPGTMVLLADESLPPFHWRMRRIEEIHRGKDDLVRVATEFTTLLLEEGAN